MPTIRFDNRHQPTRCITEEACGWACYEGRLSDADSFEGRHVGAVKTLEDGQAWLEGEHPASFIVIYPDDSGQKPDAGHG